MHLTTCLVPAAHWDQADAVLTRVESCQILERCSVVSRLRNDSPVRGGILDVLPTRACSSRGRPEFLMDPRSCRKVREPA